METRNGIMSRVEGARLSLLFEASNKDGGIRPDVFLDENPGFLMHDSKRVRYAMMTALLCDLVRQGFLSRTNDSGSAHYDITLAGKDSLSQNYFEPVIA